MREAIYSRLLEHCTPASLPRPWPAQTSSDSVMCAPLFPTATLAQLADEFPEARLLDAGVAKRDHDGTLLPADGWSRGAEQLLMPLSVSDSAAPYDLLIEGGLISGRGLPLTAVLNDAATKAAIVDNEYICIAADMPDVLALRTLGLAATLSSGLDQLNFELVQELCQAFQWPMPDLDRRTLRLDAPSQLPPPVEETNDDREEEDESEPEPKTDSQSAASPESPQQAAEQPIEAAPIPILVVVDWHPAPLSLERPSVWAGIRESLAIIERHLELGINIQQWRPTAEQLGQFRFLAEFGAADVARAALLRHFDRAPACPFIERRALGQRPATDYLSAHDRLQAAVEAPCRSSHEIAELRESLDSLLAAIDQALIRPLITQGLAERDPLRRNLTLAAADIARALRHRDDLVCRAQVKLAPIPSRANATELQAVESVLAMVNSLVSVCKRLI